MAIEEEEDVTVDKSPKKAASLDGNRFQSNASALLVHRQHQHRTDPFNVLFLQLSLSRTLFPSHDAAVVGSFTFTREADTHSLPV